MANRPQPKLAFLDTVSHAMADARRINLFGEIGLHSMSHIINSLDYMTLQSSRRPIEIRLNSHGGSVIDGLAIYDAIKHAARRTPINITVNGACMSMATVILQAATLRRAYPNSEFLLHEIQYGLLGSHTAQKDYQKQAQRLQDRLNDILVSRSKISREELEELIARRDYTISAREALEAGLIDTIVE